MSYFLLSKQLIRFERYGTEAPLSCYQKRLRRRRCKSCKKPVKHEGSLSLCGDCYF